MSNDNNKNKQPLFEKAQAPSTSRVQSAEASTTTPTVTTRNLSRSDELTIGIFLDCAKRGQNRGNQRQPSICKVSRILRDHSESSYEPLLVSIGPIHREDPKLKEFEWLKERYLDDLLRRRVDSTPKETLEACLLEVNTLIPEIRESYAGVKKNYSDVELARMMVMDGCFILEFCFKHEEEDLYLPNKMQNLRIAMDLMLLENQVPFSVLQALFDCSMGEVPFTLSQVLDVYLAPYIKVFHPQLPEKNSTTDVRSDSPEKNSTTYVRSDSTPAHVLGYLHKRYHLVAAKSSNPIHADAEASKPVDEERIENTTFHSIVELDRSGMNFKPHQKNERSMTITFQLSLLPCLPWFWACCYCCCCCCCCLFPYCLPGSFWIKPTLLMPTLLIDDFTELILRNFIAYEQSFPTDHNYFTSYAHAMDKLIDTQEDIAKLVKSEVLVNSLGTNQEAADMINKICKNVIVIDFYYTKQFKELDKHYSGFWPKHIAQLRRVYFSNPWSAIALFVGFIVFLATVVSAIFAILDYFR